MRVKIRGGTVVHGDTPLCQTIREMEDVAWILRSDPKRNEIGFVRASKLRERERYVLDED